MTRKPCLLFLCALILAPAKVFAGAFEIVHEFTEAPGNLTITPDNRIIMSLHQFYQPAVSVVEVLEEGTLRPFPNRTINRRTGGEALRLDSVLGIHCDRNGVVWMLDNGLRSGIRPRLVGWDTRKNRLHQVIEFDLAAAPENAFVNDLAVDTDRRMIYISDPAGGDNAALVIVDLASAEARRVLQGHASVLAEPLDLVIDGRPLKVKTPDGRLLRPRIGVNPIALDSRNQWLYFGAMHGRTLYRIRASALADAALDEKELAARVERYSDKPASDGIAIDKNDNVYLGELDHHAIGVIGTDRTYRRLARSPKLAWVDSLAADNNDAVYGVVNRLHLSAALNAGESLSRPPYYLVRITGPAGRSTLPPANP